MSAGYSDTVEFKKQELDDTISCCICLNVYIDPKALPCIHTFCMKCLQETGIKTKKGPGDEMPCPICRRQFQIPQEGFRALPNNFFIAKLIQVANISDPSVTSTCLCDACLEDNEKTGKQTPTADMYCIECKQKLCEECCRHHRKLKLTKNHKLMPINEHEGDQSMTAHLAPSVCERHKQKILNVYCADCKTVVCATCFIDHHKNHVGSHIIKFVDGFRKQIENNIETINHCSSQIRKKKDELVKIKEYMQQRVGMLEFDVINRRDELKQFVDTQADSLLQSLCSVRQIKLKELQMEDGDIDSQLSCLQSYSSYCQKIMAKGSASDICRAVSGLSVRAMEMQQQCQSLIEEEILPFKLCFTKSAFEKLLKDENLIGEIEDCRTSLVDIKQERQKMRNSWKGEKEHIVSQIQEQHRIIGKPRFKLDPVFVQTIKTIAGEEENKWIHGLTILDKELFVVSDESSEVEVYDSMNFSFSRRWNLMELIRPQDIVSCNRNKCLYIFDYIGMGQSKQILRVGPNGKIIKEWPTGSDWGYCLSVTNESNVILAVSNKSKLNEYSSDGQLIREIYLSSEKGFRPPIRSYRCRPIRSPMHAIRLTSGHFVVSHCVYDDDLHRVCVVDGDGKIKKSFGGKRGSTTGQINCPVYLAVDGNGFVMVADRGNNRVLLLDSDLKFKREILSGKKRGLRRPQRILLDQTNNRLFVADNGWDSKKKIYRDGRILIFEFRELSEL